jgi:hypothetical protein
VLIEFASQILLCTLAVALIFGGGKELALAIRTGSQRWNFVRVLQDDEAALCYVHWITFRFMSATRDSSTGKKAC